MILHTHAHIHTQIQKHMSSAQLGVLTCSRYTMASCGCCYDEDYLVTGLHVICSKIHISECARRPLEEGGVILLPGSRFRQKGNRSPSPAQPSRVEAAELLWKRVLPFYIRETGENLGLVCTS